MPQRKHDTEKEQRQQEKNSKFTKTAQKKMTHVMSKPNVGTWADFLIKATARRFHFTFLLSDFVCLKRRENCLPESPRRLAIPRPNRVTTTKCQKNWLQSLIEKERAVANFWCRKMSLIIAPEYHTLFDIDVKLRMSRVPIRDGEVRGVRCLWLTGKGIHLTNIW